jgi:hypothetical protein
MKKSLTVLLFVVVGTFLCRNALALETYIPHITKGEAAWTDYLQINNNTPSAASFTLTLYNNGTQSSSQLLSVGGLSRSQIELKALNPNAETGIITYTEPGLVFRVSYKSTGGGVAEFKTIDTLNSRMGFYFSDFVTFVEWKGAAIANMGTTPAVVTLYALGGSVQGSGGSILGTYTETIQPRDKIVGLHGAWFSSVGLGQLESIVAVTGSPSLCGIAIASDQAQSRLLFTPAVPVANFNPQTQTSEWNLTGTENLDGTFTVTADVVLTISGGTFSAVVTSKLIAGLPEPYVITLTGSFNETTGTGTITNQVITINVGGASETSTVNGSFTITGNSLTGSFNTVVQGWWGTSYGTITGTGTRKM